MYQFKLIVIIFFSGFGICACNVKSKKVISSENKIVEVINDQYADTIAFLLFEIQSNKNKTLSKLTLKSITKNAGILKDKNLYQDNSENKLCFYFYDRDLVVDSLFLEHPLTKNVEFTDEQNKFVTKQLDLDSTGFFIRIQLKDNYKVMIVNEVFNKKYNKLLNFQLK